MKIVIKDNREVYPNEWTKLIVSIVSH